MGKRNFSVKKGNDVLSGVTAFNGRTGNVTPAVGDYDFIELGDAPSAYTSAGGYFPQVNAALTGLQFVDIGFSGAIEVAAVATVALPAETYANGASGVGATLTANANGAMGTVDSQAAALNKRYLIMYYTGANRYKNGVYQLSTVGTAGTQRVLTRTTDSDQPTKFTAADGTQQIVFAAYTGGSHGRKYFTQGQIVTTVGTSFITYVANRAGSQAAGLAAVLGVSNDAGGLDITNLVNLTATGTVDALQGTFDNITIGNGTTGLISDGSGFDITFDTVGNQLTINGTGTKAVSISNFAGALGVVGTNAFIGSNTVDITATNDITISGVNIDADAITGDFLLPDWTFDFGVGLDPIADGAMRLGTTGKYINTSAINTMFTTAIREKTGGGGITCIGNFSITGAGNGLKISTGANAKMGTSALTNGTVTVSTTAARSTSQIFLTRLIGAGATRGILTVGTIVDATSFVIRSEDLTGTLSADDDSTVAWVMVDPV